jgi:hypothetical protein
VPTPLAATAVRAAMHTAAGRSAAGVTSAAALALADGMAGTFLRGKVAAVLLLVLMAASALGVAALRGPDAPADSDAPAAPPAAAPAKAPAAPGGQADAGKTMTVVCRVVDADGRPVAAAEVAALAMPRQWDVTTGEESIRLELVAEARSDADGQFRLRVPRPAKAPMPGTDFYPTHLLVRAPGFAAGLMALDPQSDRKPAVLRLPPEQVLRGRLIDLQGQPARGVKLRVAAVMEKVGNEGRGVVEPDRPAPAWFAPLVTDGEGRFQVQGIGRNQFVMLQVQDTRFANEALKLWTTDEERGKEVTHALAPARWLTGRVRYKDSGQPAAGARVTAPGMEAQTDRDGRFRVNPIWAGGQFLAVQAPAGEPYLGVTRPLEKPKTGAPPALDLELPRGLLVQGKLTEEGTGRPVAGGVVYYLPCVAGNAAAAAFLTVGPVFAAPTAADGTFQLAVLPGPGHLLAKGPTPDFRLHEIGQQVLQNNQPGGARSYVHGLTPIDFKADSGPQKAEITLRRGLKVRGTVLSPDGKPAVGARMFTRLTTCAPMIIEEVRGVPVPGGKFALGGCEPERAYPAVFLDEKNGWGAAIELSGRQAGAPLTVRLQPCGTARARFLDRNGKPLEQYWPEVEMMFTPGPHRFDRKAMEKGLLAGDAVHLANLHERGYQWNNGRTEREGRVTLPNLVPGVTYRIVSSRLGGVILKEFTVRAGETLDLQDIRVVRPK